jgi:hypothetical protein
LKHTPRSGNRYVRPKQTAPHSDSANCIRVSGHRVRWAEQHLRASGVPSARSHLHSSTKLSCTKAAQMPAGSQMIKPKCVNDALECPTRERPFQVALRMFTGFEYLVGQRNPPERRVGLNLHVRGISNSRRGAGSVVHPAWTQSALSGPDGYP